MDDLELEALLSDIESDRVERKASIADRERICEAICAFANDLPNHRKPGVVFIGIHDNGSCANLPIDDKLLLTLSELRSNGNILPFPTMTVQKGADREYASYSFFQYCGWRGQNLLSLSFIFDVRGNWLSYHSRRS